MKKNNLDPQNEALYKGMVSSLMVLLTLLWNFTYFVGTR